MDKRELVYTVCKQADVDSVDAIIALRKTNWNLEEAIYVLEVKKKQEQEQRADKTLKMQADRLAKNIASALTGLYWYWLWWVYTKPYVEHSSWLRIFLELLYGWVLQQLY